MRYFLIILLFPLLSFGQSSPCTNCPGGLTAPGFNINKPQPKFNGYTSEVDTFDGAAPTCFLPEDTTLNGVIAGIDNALCDLRERLDSISILYQDDSIIANRVDSILNELNNIYSTIIISTDSSIYISPYDSLGTTYWDLILNMSVIGEELVENLNFDCFDPNVPMCDSLITNQLQKIIDNVAALYAISPDTCVAWDFYCNVIFNSYDSSAILEIEPLSDTITGSPSGMCLQGIQYIWQVIDSNGNILANDVLNVSTTLGVTTSIYIPYGYALDAVTLNLIARFTKYQCDSYDDCGYFDYTDTLSFGAP